MKDLPNPLCRVHLIQQVWEIMNDENEQLNKEIVKLKDKTKRIIEYFFFGLSLSRKRRGFYATY